MEPVICHTISQGKIDGSGEAMGRIKALPNIFYELTLTLKTLRCSKRITVKYSMKQSVHQVVPCQLTESGYTTECKTF